VLLSRNDSFKGKIYSFCITYSLENKNELERYTFFKKSVF